MLEGLPQQWLKRGPVSLLLLPLHPPPMLPLFFIKAQHQNLQMTIVLRMMLPLLLLAIAMMPMLMR
jgi:hypothetical protein